MTAISSEDAIRFFEGLSEDAKERVRTGQINVKFNFEIESEQIGKIVKMTNDLDLKVAFVAGAIKDQFADSGRPGITCSIESKTRWD